jgi:hypothetical protein
MRTRGTNTIPTRHKASVYRDPKKPSQFSISEAAASMGVNGPMPESCDSGFVDRPPVRETTEVLGATDVLGSVDGLLPLEFPPDGGTVPTVVEVVGGLDGGGVEEAIKDGSRPF